MRRYTLRQPDGSIITKRKGDLLLDEFQRHAEQYQKDVAKYEKQIQRFERGEMSSEELNRFEAEFEFWHPLPGQRKSPPAV
jgi:hypothetical protein